MRVVIPDAFSHVPSQLKRTLVAEPDLWMWRKSSANAMRSKAKMLSSRPLGWIAGWRFDRIRSVADRGAAMQLLAANGMRLGPRHPGMAGLTICQICPGS